MLELLLESKSKLAPCSMIFKIEPQDQKEVNK